ncbi:MAG: HAD-IB family hydrolase [Verrucomicrobia bacterium]|nr:HAD-IB family hydrolase [Verrucomicrobiota bacterium]
MNPALSSDPPPGIALFDLDGTLIAWDCQLLFRHHVIRREPWRAVFLPVFLGCLPFYKILKTAGLKRVFLSFLWRMKPATLAANSRSFAEAIQSAIYPELRDLLAAHRRQGHLLVLTSASPEFYVTEIGRALGFHLALGTPVATTPVCPFVPALQNHRGPSKVERLRQTLPGAYFEEGKLLRSHGYTDSCADLPMLSICQAATVVNPARTLAALATQSGWQIIRPARPWHSRTGFICRVLALLTGLGRSPAGIGHPPSNLP